jgi:hypothetical protein
MRLGEIKMKWYLEKVKEIMGSFDKIAFTKVPREHWESSLYSYLPSHQ